MTAFEDMLRTFKKVYGDEITDEDVKEMENIYEEVCGEPAH